ncbi:Rhamnogalacturonate lyase [Linum perenne]
METHAPDDFGGYYDVSWEVPGGKGQTEQVVGTKYTVINETEDQVEVSFSRQWDSSLKGKVPLNVDKRFIVQKGVSGFYWYVIVERLKGWPDVDMDQHRMVFRPLIKIFKYMAVSDEIQKIMPEYIDRTKGKPLAYPEAVLLTDPVDPVFKGQVDDKYQYSMEMKDHRLKGWVSENPKIGFWVISPSEEYAAGGPVKPELTCHCGPIALAMFTSVHYSGLDMHTEYKNGEPWKKVFGPVFIYLNSIVPSNDYAALWKDAKAQMEKEVQNWPYSFVQSPDYLPADKRGTVSGQLLVDDNWVPGVVGSFKHPDLVNVQPGGEVKLGPVTYKAPRNGPTLWEIGIPDRSAAEFYVPDPDPQYRQYGLWERYTQLYPKTDLVFEVGKSNYSKDWFFAHVLRESGPNNYIPTTWQIIFDLPDVAPAGNYTLQLALASAQETNTFVYVNDLNAKTPAFATERVGKDNAIARHGIHGIYWFFTAGLPSKLFVKGKNTIFLKSARGCQSALSGVMYDYIRLEGPPAA